MGAAHALSVHTSTLLAAAGEYYVLSQLSLRGHIAAPAPKGVPNADILVSDITGTRLFAVQVKARLDKGSDHGWHMKKKHEDLRSETLVYCFVDFHDGIGAAPTTFVLPSKVVADVLTRMHQLWLSIPGKRGPHNDNEMRRFLPDYSLTLGNQCKEFVRGWLDPYREAWKIFD